MYEDRKIKILEMFENRRTLKIEEISLALSYSWDTVRRDLKAMENEGLLKYVRGGATKDVNIIENFHQNDFEIRQIKNLNKKMIACKKAVSEIKKDDVIFINSGTTGALLAHVIAKTCMDISVITNNFQVVSAIGNSKNNINVTFIGGLVDMTEKSTYGFACENECVGYFPDVCFLSINAVNDSLGFTDFRLKEFGVMKSIQKNSKKVIAIMDSSKIDKNSQKQLFELGDIDILYTDGEISNEKIEHYENLGLSIK